MPLIIGGGNLDVGLKYLDEQARQRAAALDAARFSQGVTSQNQQLSNQRADSYNRAIKQTQQAGTNLLTHQADIDARDRAAALDSARLYDFHNDDVDFNNRKLGQQDVLNQRDNDRAMESAQLRAQALADAREQNDQVRQERMTLTKQQADETAQRNKEAQIQREIMSNPEFKVAMASALENKDYPDEAQRHIDRAHAIEAEVRARHEPTIESSSLRASALTPVPTMPESVTGLNPFNTPSAGVDALMPMPEAVPDYGANEQRLTAEIEARAQEMRANNGVQEEAQPAPLPPEPKPIETAPVARDWTTNPPKNRNEERQMQAQEKQEEKRQINEVNQQSVEDRKAAREEKETTRKAKLKNDVLSQATTKSFATWAKNATEAGLSPEEIADAHPFTRTLKDIGAEYETADDKKAYLEYVNAELNGVPPMDRANKYFKAALPLKSDLPDDEKITPVMAWQKEVATKWAELKKTPGARADILRALKELDGPKTRTVPQANELKRVMTNEDFAALKSGEQFIDPKGQIRRKP